MTIFDMLQMFGSNLWFYGGTFLLVLGILVFVHEWGHYIVARMCGVRVECFSIGFGPELCGWNGRNGTRWKISLIPLGGYVKLFGDTDPASADYTDEVENDAGEVRPMTEAEKKVAFFSKPVSKRAAIVFAGPAINYVFAVFILMGLYLVQGQPVSPPVAAAVIVGSSAEKYGFQPQDRIISIDGKNIESFQDIRREMMIALDTEKKFVLNRDGQTLEIMAQPQRVEVTDRFGFKSSIGVLGVLPADQAIEVSNIVSIDGQTYDSVADIEDALKKKMGTTYLVEFTADAKDGESVIEKMIVHPVADMNTTLGTIPDDQPEILYLAAQAPNEFVSHTPMTAAQSAIRQTYVITRDSLNALWQIVVGTRSATELGGIIRIGAIAGDMAQQGIIAVILLTALLSVNLGFINLLPIPLLDGGHLMFYFFEAVMGRPVPEMVQEYAFRAGLVFLIGIMAFANINDVLQLMDGMGYNLK